MNANVLAQEYEETELVPPRFAIADCFVAGTFSEIDESTLIERQAVGLVQTRGLVKVVYGGPGNVLQSHLLSWDNRNATIASRVPSVPTLNDFRVVLAGPMTTAQELVVAKQHECDGVRVHALEVLLRSMNPLYKDVNENPEFHGVGESHEVYCTRLNVSNGTNRLVERARARQQTVAAPSDSNDKTIDETSILPTETVVVETAVDNDEEACLSRAVDMIMGRPTYIARRSTSILQHNDPYYLERVYPHLLTFGIGGFSSSRSHRYSKRDVVLHYLNVSSNRFAGDPLFKIQMYDYLATERVKNGVFVRVRHDPNTATRAMHVSAEELRGAMEARVAMRRAARTEKPVTSGEGRNCANSVLKAINASTAKMWGSNEERDGFQRKVNAMTFMYGEPSVFWTLTPYSEGSIAVAFWSGYDLPNKRPTDLAACTVVNMPSTASMKRLTMQNTMLQARYFEMCCKILIEIMFGWDSTVSKPKREPGIFGFVEAFFYALEQQGRLRVHIHEVMWVAGLPKTKTDWEKLLAASTMRTRFESYCASIFAAELPVFRGVEQIKCPTPGCIGNLASLDIPSKYKHRLKTGTPPPKTAICDVCKQQLTDANVAALVIERKWNELDAEHKAVSTENTACTLRLRFGGLSAHEPTASVQLSRLLQHDQVHAYEHTSSCVKGTSGTACRYHFFRDLENKTQLTDDGKMKYRRSVGNQWLNPYIPIWRRLLHFNMDARILWSGNSLQAIQYAMQYASKRQSTLDNINVMELAMRRREEREATTLPTNRTEIQQGIGRLMSLAYSASSTIEIGGPLATAILLKGGAGTFSCKFERLVLVEGLQTMADKDIESSVVRRDNDFVIESSIRHYIARPRCLEQCCWYDFCAWFKPSKSKATISGEACTFASNDPHLVAVHSRLHGLTRGEYPSVPEIIGPRLPDARLLENAEHSDQAELYCRAAALLYCPFRRPQDFLDNNGSARAHFLRWNPNAHPKVQRSLEFHQQHYVALDEASEFRAQPTTDSEDSTCDDPDVLNSHFERASGAAAARSENLLAVGSDVYTAVTNPINITDEEAALLQNAAEESAVKRLLSNNVELTDLPADQISDVSVRSVPVRMSDLESFEQQLADKHPPERSSTNNNDFVQTTEITVELLNAAVADLTIAETNSLSIDNLTPFASVQSVSSAFNLNKEQHLAFLHVAVPLLYRIADITMPPQSTFCGDPLIITGAGGTGKTRIVDALRCLACNWGRPKCIMATASSGIAAANLKGHTMHSAVNLGINQKCLPRHIQKPGDKLRTKWDPVLCVVADEMSMTDVGFFGLWEEALQKVKDCRQPFGGLLGVFMFDFFQLLTVRGIPVFRVADSQKPYSEIQARGSLLYRSVNKVVYLTQNMRFESDPEWGEWLAQAREGNWVPELREFLGKAGPPPADDLHGQFIQVVSTDNAYRKRINDAAIQIACRALDSERKVYAVPAQLPATLTPAKIAQIADLADSQTGNIPVFLKAYIGNCTARLQENATLINLDTMQTTGMPVRVKSNQCIPKGVANGAGASLYHIDWRAGTTFDQKPDGVWVASEPPTNLYVGIHSNPTPTQFPSNPTQWPTSVMPIVQSKVSFKLQKDTISVKGFPVVPAFGVTVHGVQGDTRNQIVVTDLRPPHCRTVDRHALYVSR
ncbi:hypothetical protein PRNP1_004928 [Phytophthora ramorum]